MNEILRNKIFIMHSAGTSSMSQMIQVVTYLNHLEDKTIFTHNALVYLDDDGKKWLMEADVEEGIVIKEGINITEGQKVLYTPLPDNILPKCCFAKLKRWLNIFCQNNHEECPDLSFKSFIEKTFKENSSYSLKKALQSLQMKILADFNIWETFKEKIEAEIKKDSINPNAKNAIVDLFKAIAEALNKKADSIAEDEIKKSFQTVGVAVTNVAEKINKGMTDEYAKGILNMHLIERSNKDENKKFWYCTEFLLTVLREWCRTTNVYYPDMLLDLTIFCQKPEEIYPHELYLLLKSQGAKMLETI